LEFHNSHHFAFSPNCSVASVGPCEQVKRLVKVTGAA
jgi:hypothetical protein